MRKLTIPLLLLVVGATSAASDGATEDFATFLVRFAAEDAFRIQRIDLPLHTILGNPTEPRVKERWSLAEIHQRFNPPVPSSDLEAVGLEQQVTYPSKTEVDVQQAQRQSDSYMLIYRFKRIRGQWRLASYEDRSY